MSCWQRKALTPPCITASSHKVRLMDSDGWQGRIRETIYHFKIFML